MSSQFLHGGGVCVYWVRSQCLTINFPVIFMDAGKLKHLLPGKVYPSPMLNLKLFQRADFPHKSKLTGYN